MHYIPKYSRDRQNKRRSQKFVTVLDKIDNLDGISLSKITNFVEESQEIIQSKIFLGIIWVLLITNLFLWLSQNKLMALGCFRTNLNQD